MLQAPLQKYDCWKHSAKEVINKLLQGGLTVGETMMPTEDIDDDEHSYVNVIRCVVRHSLGIRLVIFLALLWCKC